MANVSKTTIVVLLHGRPQTFGRGNAVLATQVDALLAAWRPGEMGGTAIVDLLMGKETPSGKLSQSWPRTVGHVHSGSSPWLQPVAGKWVANNKGCESLSTEGRCYNPYVFDGWESTPLFPFGFGLSYTTFDYVGMDVTPAAPGATTWSLMDLEPDDDDDDSRGGVQGGLDQGKGVFVAGKGEGHAATGRKRRRLIADTDPRRIVANVTVHIRNTGTTFTGQEVAQLYVEDPANGEFVPYWRRLIGFAKSPSLAPNESVALSIPILWTDLAVFDRTMELRVYPGTYKLFAGAHSSAASLNATLVVV